MSTVDDLVTAIQHAHAQVESIVAGSVDRIARIQDALGQLQFVYDNDVARTVAISCAIGSENSARRALEQAMAAMRQEIDHLLSAAAPPGP